MKRTDDFRIAPGDGLRYFAPEPTRDRHDREGGYIVPGLGDAGDRLYGLAQ